MESNGGQTNIKNDSVMRQQGHLRWFRAAGAGALLLSFADHANLPAKTCGRARRAGFVALPPDGQAPRLARRMTWLRNLWGSKLVVKKLLGFEGRAHAMRASVRAHGRAFRCFTLGLPV